MARKVEVQVFKQTTQPPRYHSYSILQIAAVLFAIAMSIVGFLVIDPVSILKKWTDVSLFRLYSQNKELQKTVRQIEEQTEFAQQRMSHTDSIRQSVILTAGLPKDEPAIAEVEEEAPEEIGSIGPARNMKKIREAHRKFRHLLSSLEENPQFARTLPLIYPLKHHEMVTGRFGLMHDQNTGNDLPHRGIDWAAPDGDTVIAPGAGMVASIYSDKGFGLCLTIVHNERTETFYAHLSGTLVHLGQSVSRGQPIALVGRSGRTAGPHLHYEVHLREHPVNPEDYFLTP